MAENTKIIISAVDKTKKGFGSVTSGLKKVTKAVFSMRTALVGAAGAAGIGFLIKKNLDAIDVLGKAAARVGTTTEALSKLHFAADITGVKTETVNMAMQRFTRRLAEATRGTGEAKDALKRLNLDASKLIELPLDEQMLALADAFGEGKSGAEKVSLAMKLFDSEGVALVNTLNLGSDGMRELFKEAETLGLVLSSTAVKGVEQTNDELKRMLSLIKGLSLQTTAAFAPAIKEVAKLVKEWGIELATASGGMDQVGKAIAESLINGLVGVLKTFQTFANGIIVTINEISAALRSMFPPEAKKALQDRLSDIFALPIATLKKDGVALRAEIVSLQEQIASFDGGVKIDLIDLSPTINKLLGLSKAVTKPLEEIEDEIITMGKQPWWASLMQPLWLGMEKFNEAADRVKPTLFDLNKSMDSFVTGSMAAFTQGFTDAITGAKSFSDAMKSMAKSVVDSLIKMLVQYYITQSIFGAITGMFGGDSSPKSVSSLNANLPDARNMFNGNGGGFTGMGSRSGGVDHKGGFPAILHPNETVIDHTKGQSSGVVVQQTINVTTGVQQTVRAEIVQLMPQIAQAAKGAVADARLRGGNFSKAMGGA